MSRPPRIAIVHDWLTFIGGAEKVVIEMLKCFPGADLFVIVDGLSPHERKLFQDVSPYTRITPSFIQRLPWAKKHFEYYLPLMPLAVEQWDLRKYDLIISSSHAFAKGVITSPDQLHISYVYSPIRYAWDMQSEYLSSSPNMAKGLRGMLARVGLHYLRMWDLRTVPSVDVWFCISHFIARRIHKFYGVTAEVIYPPVETTSMPNIEKRLSEQKYYVTCSRLVEYKKIDLIVQTFINMKHDSEPRKLLVIGDGPMLKPLKAMAKHCPHIEITGRLNDETMHEKVARAQAFIFAAKEDFGIAPLEAQALGVPVIAFGEGGARETVVDINDEMPTGLFFYEQTPESLLAAIQKFEHCRERFVPAICRHHAERFSAERFRKHWTLAVNSAWQAFQERR